ncbi:MAG: hypothetical protein WBG54_01090 [Acidobacteriaceae bacterium]
MNSKVMDKEQCYELAQHLSELSREHLEVNGKPKQYVAIEVGPGPFKNAARVWGSHVTFCIRSTELVQRINLAGFTTKPGRPQAHDCRIFGLSKETVDINRALFEEVVRESVEFVHSQKSANSRSRLRN